MRCMNVKYVYITEHYVAYSSTYVHIHVAVMSVDESTEPHRAYMQYVKSSLLLSVAGHAVIFMYMARLLQVRSSSRVETTLIPEA